LNSPEDNHRIASGSRTRTSRSCDDPPNANPPFEPPEPQPGHRSAPPVFRPWGRWGKSTTLKSNNNFSIFARQRPSARSQFSGYFAIALRQSSCVQVRN